MTKRAKTICAASLLALASVVVALVLWPQPTYQGKTLQWWLRQAPNDWYVDGQVAQREALRSFGPTALPELLSAVEGRPSWRERLERMDDWLFQTSHQRVRLFDHPDSQPDWHRQFEMLGEVAEPAAKDLAVLLQSQDAAVASRAADALAAIGTTNALNALASLLNSTNAALRAAAAHGLASFGPRAHDHVPALLRQTMDPDRTAARCALFALRSVPTEAAPLIPVFTNALASGDFWKQSIALKFLRSWGSATAPAAPAISNLLQSVNPNDGMHRQLWETLNRLQCDVRDGAVVRGPRDRKQIALLFTGHDFAEGGDTILAALARHQAKASFFLTGSFLTNATCAPLVRGICGGIHYYSVHSDQHLLYCSWDFPPKTLVSRWEFGLDVMRNFQKFGYALGIRPYDPQRSDIDLSTLNAGHYFVPPYEHWNLEIAHWAHSLNSGYELLGYTPGTRANADYTEDGASNFVSSQAIFDSILAREREDPKGLNGFLLLLHLGAGPKRTDKFHTRLDELLTVLAAKGYQFVRVDELLDPPPR